MQEEEEEAGTKWLRSLLRLDEDVQENVGKGNGGGRGVGLQRSMEGGVLVGDGGAGAGEA